MNVKAKYLMLAVAIFSLPSAMAQSDTKEKFVIKASGDKCITRALCLDSDLPDISTKSTPHLGIDFGMNVWQRDRHSLDVLTGVGYDLTTLNADLPEMDYHYPAPASADMDNETYVRYYEIDGLHQQIKVERITVPLYIEYRYRLSSRFSIHALLGYRFGFNFSSKVSELTGDVFSYGVYPQYGNLMIDAPYMNAFGASVLNSENATNKPNVYKVGASFLTGAGIEFRVWGPIALGASLKYEASMTDMFKPVAAQIIKYDAEDAPVTYTVAGGQKVKTLSDYFSLSKISRLSYSVSLVFRF